MPTISKILAAAAAIAAIIALAACSTTDTAAPTSSSVEATEEDPGTTGQKNAVRKAKEYLSVSAFSRAGLIKQLEFEGFPTDDATYAADKVNADWNEQAVKKAKEYLAVSGFSRSGLVEQLQFDGFTPEQAEHGAASEYGAETKTPTQTATVAPQPTQQQQTYETPAAVEGAPCPVGTGATVGSLYCSDMDGVWRQQGYHEPVPGHAPADPCATTDEWMLGQYEDAGIC